MDPFPTMSPAAQSSVTNARIHRNSSNPAAISSMQKIKKAPNRDTAGLCWRRPLESVRRVDRAACASFAA
jgi:hypothetical protein